MVTQIIDMPVTRQFILLLLCIAFFDTFCNQDKKGKKAEESKLSPNADTNGSMTDTSTFHYGEFISTSFNIQFPIRKLGWTSDYEQIFSTSQRSILDSIISTFEKETTIEIAIITIESSWTSKENFDSFTLAIARNWGVGKKEKNNGILIGISTGLRSIRIQNGYGIEPKLSNAETKKIIDDIIFPEFKKGKYFEGTNNGLLALMKKLR